MKLSGREADAMCVQEEAKWWDGPISGDHQDISRDRETSGKP